MRTLKYLLMVFGFVTATLAGGWAVGAIDLSNKEFFFLPVTPVKSELPDVVQDREGDVLAVPDNENLGVLDIPYDGRLLFRFVHDKITGQVVFLSVFQGEELVYANDFEHNLGYIQGDTVIPFARFVDIDINENGLKDIVLESYTGGAHCCTTTLFFEYDQLNQLMFKGKLPSMHTALNFTNLDYDDALEIEYTDPTFAYWKAPYSNSAKPRVVMDYNDQWYQTSSELMLAEIDEDMLKKKAEDIKMDEDAWKGDAIPSALIQTVIDDIVFTGNGQMLSEFLDRAWPDQYSDRRQGFMEELQEQLKKSPFWSKVAAMNGWPSEYPLVTPVVTEQELAPPAEIAGEAMTEGETETHQSPLTQGPEKQPPQQIVPESNDDWAEKNLKEDKNIRTYFEF